MPACRLPGRQAGQTVSTLLNNHFCYVFNLLLMAISYD